MRVLCRRTTPDDFGRNRWADISIHVLRVEDDITAAGKLHGFVTDFNPRPPCGGRLPWPTVRAVRLQFQSTSSVWRTTSRCTTPGGPGGISIHVLRVEDDLPETLSCTASSISIHVLRVEDDIIGLRIQRRVMISIHVLRVEDDRKLKKRVFGTDISIHVLRVEDDADIRWSLAQLTYFNPRPPCGGRRTKTARCRCSNHFNPRPPCGGRLLTPSRPAAIANFNPRPPCGGRRTNRHTRPGPCRFQSTSSVWRTTEPYDLDSNKITLFQSTSSVWRTTLHDLTAKSNDIGISIHVLRVEDDIIRTNSVGYGGDFNPRPPCGGRL